MRTAKDWRPTKETGLYDPKSTEKNGRTLTYEDGLKEGYDLAIAMLRNEEAPKEMKGPYPYNDSWADWLESKRGED